MRSIRRVLENNFKTDVWKYSGRRENPQDDRSPSYMTFGHSEL
jgi:hypothetical protein